MGIRRFVRQRRHPVDLTEVPGQFLVFVDTTPLGHCAKSFMCDSTAPAPPP